MTITAVAVQMRKFRALQNAMRLPHDLLNFPALELKKIEGGKDARLLMKQFAVYMDTLGKLIH